MEEEGEIMDTTTSGSHSAPVATESSAGEHDSSGAASAPTDASNKVHELSRNFIKSVEGYALIITNLHEEIQEEDIVDKFSEFGDVRNISFNLDRKTGFAKGYALVEYDNLQDAKTAAEEMNGGILMDRQIRVDFAFVQSTSESRYSNRDYRDTSDRDRDDDNRRSRRYSR